MASTSSAPKLPMPSRFSTLNVFKFNSSSKHEPAAASNDGDDNVALAGNGGRGVVDNVPPPPPPPKDRPYTFLPNRSLQSLTPPAAAADVYLSQPTTPLYLGPAPPSPAPSSFRKRSIRRPKTSAGPDSGGAGSSICPPFPPPSPSPSPSPAPPESPTTSMAPSGISTAPPPRLSVKKSLFKLGALARRVQRPSAKSVSSSAEGEGESAPRSAASSFSLFRGQSGGSEVASDHADDDGISLPWNFQHNIHVDEAYTGLPPSWSASLVQAGFSEEEIRAIRDRRTRALPTYTPTRPPAHANTVPQLPSRPGGVLAHPAPRSTSLMRQYSDASLASSHRAHNTDFGPMPPPITHAHTLPGARSARAQSPPSATASTFSYAPSLPRAASSSGSLATGEDAQYVYVDVQRAVVPIPPSVPALVVARRGTGTGRGRPSAGDSVAGSGSLDWPSDDSEAVHHQPDGPDTPIPDIPADANPDSDDDDDREWNRDTIIAPAPPPGVKDLHSPPPPSSPIPPSPASQRVLHTRPHRPRELKVVNADPPTPPSSMPPPPAYASPSRPVFGLFEKGGQGQRREEGEGRRDDVRSKPDLEVRAKGEESLPTPPAEMEDLEGEGREVPAARPAEEESVTSSSLEDDHAEEREVNHEGYRQESQEEEVTLDMDDEPLSAPRLTAAPPRLTLALSGDGDTSMGDWTESLFSAIGSGVATDGSSTVGLSSALGSVFGGSTSVLGSGSSLGTALSWESMRTGVSTSTSVSAGVSVDASASASASGSGSAGLRNIGSGKSPVAEVKEKEALPKRGIGAPSTSVGLASLSSGPKPRQIGNTGAATASVKRGPEERSTGSMSAAKEERSTGSMSAAKDAKTDKSTKGKGDTASVETTTAAAQGPATRKSEDNKDKATDKSLQQRKSSQRLQREPSQQFQRSPPRPSVPSHQPWPMPLPIPPAAILSARAAMSARHQSSASVAAPSVAPLNIPSCAIPATSLTPASVSASSAASPSSVSPSLASSSPSSPSSVATPTLAGSSSMATSTRRLPPSEISVPPTSVPAINVSADEGEERDYGHTGESAGVERRGHARLSGGAELTGSTTPLFDEVMGMVQGPAALLLSRTTDQLLPTSAARTSILMNTPPSTAGMLTAGLAAGPATPNTPFTPAMSDTGSTVLPASEYERGTKERDRDSNMSTVSSVTVTAATIVRGMRAVANVIEPGVGKGRGTPRRGSPDGDATGAPRGIPPTLSVIDTDSARLPSPYSPPSSASAASPSFTNLSHTRIPSPTSSAIPHHADTNPPSPHSTSSRSHFSSSSSSSSRASGSASAGGSYFARVRERDVQSPASEEPDGGAYAGYELQEDYEGEQELDAEQDEDTPPPVPPKPSSLAYLDPSTLAYQTTFSCTTPAVVAKSPLSFEDTVKGPDVPTIELDAFYASARPPIQAEALSEPQAQVAGRLSIVTHGSEVAGLADSPVLSVTPPAQSSASTSSLSVGTSSSAAGSSPSSSSASPSLLTPVTTNKYRGWQAEVVASLEEWIDDTVDPRNHYVDLLEIAEGESGSVFAAHVVPVVAKSGAEKGKQRALNIAPTALSANKEVVAIKNVAILPSGSQKLVDLRRELDALRGVCHENVLTMDALYMDLVDDALWIRMELMERSLADLVGLVGQGLVLHERTMARVASDVLLALKYLQGLGIAHRDVRSDNLLLNNEGIFKVADFSNAVRLQLDNPIQSDSVGVIYWQAPEMRSGSYNALKVDVWSLGATVWEMAQAEPPFANVTDACQIGNRWPALTQPEIYSRSFHDFLRLCSQPASTRPDPGKLLKTPFVQNACGRIVIIQLLAQCKAIEERSLLESTS